MIPKKNSISATCSPKTKLSTSSWPLPSLRLVIVCVSLAVTLTMSAMIIFVDVRAPTLADIFLSTIYFPLGQGLQLKARRWSNNKTECFQFFKTKDENFRRFDGLQCGHAFWQSTANIEEKDRYVKKIATHYKLFETESLASKYFHEYWHEKLKDPLSTNFYDEETENAPKAGDEFRAFRWDPLSPLTTEVSSIAGESPWIHRATATARHIIYIFRWEKQQWGFKESLIGINSFKRLRNYGNLTDGLLQIWATFDLIFQLIILLTSGFRQTTQMLFTNVWSLFCVSPVKWVYSLKKERPVNLICQAIELCMLIDFRSQSGWGHNSATIHSLQKNRSQKVAHCLVFLLFIRILNFGLR